MEASGKVKSKRAILVEAGRFEIHKVEVEPSAGQVLVKVSVCGLCNWELNHFEGKLGTFPQAIGHEWSGVVTALGEGVTTLQVGEHVVGTSFPGFTEYTIASADACFKIPDTIKLEEALGEPLKCVITVLRAACPEAGDYGVVQGAGPMGLWCISALSGNMLTALIAVDINDQKLALAKRFGATHAINSKCEDVAARVREITGGQMADFVIEGTGVPELLETAVTYLRVGRGRLVAMSSHQAPASTFDFREALEKAVILKMVHPNYSTDQLDDMRRAIELLAKGVFRNGEIITHVYQLDDIQNAFADLARKPDGFIKGIVVL